MSRKYDESDKKKEYGSRMYYHYKSLGICVICHSNPAVENRIKCTECRDRHKEANKGKGSEYKKAYNKERYDWLKETGMCVHCGKEEAMTGQVRCIDCAEKFDGYNANPKRKTEESRKKAAERARKRRAARIEAGMCSTCGKRSAQSGLKSCGDCIIKSRRKYAENSKHTLPRSLYIQYGLCHFCGEPVLKGKKTCPKHYEQMSRQRKSLNKIMQSESRRSRKGTSKEYLIKRNKMYIRKMVFKEAVEKFSAAPMSFGVKSFAAEHKLKV